MGNLKVLVALFPSAFNKLEVFRQLHCLNALLIVNVKGSSIA